MISQEEAKILSKKWNSIYPAYIDKSKSINEGRRISSEIAVQNPGIKEIGEALQILAIPFIFDQRAAYSKDWLQRGRFKVQIKKENGQLSNPIAKNKKILLRIISQKINETEYRQNLVKKQKEDELKEQQAQQTQSKKKNKK